MEWIKVRGALKSSFFSEIAVVTSQQVCYDDVRGFANVTCEDFSVDDLLDFSDKDFEEGSFQESEEDEAKDSFSASSEERNFVNNNEFGAFPEGELAVPVDEMENLEWLSQFVDDSGTDVSLLCHVENFREETGSFIHSRCEPVIRESYSLTPVCKKPRGKRSRPSGRVAWAFGSPSITSQSSSILSTLQGFSTDFPCMFKDPVYKSDVFFNVEKRPTKKQKKKSYRETGSESQTLRRCTHCQVQKTPQWRTGPLGPKTLCNACGVRFKSGRLFPEYRPACSPTFSQEVHSNSHRKVLEMRQRKMGNVPDVGSTPNC